MSGTGGVSGGKQVNQTGGTGSGGPAPPSAAELKARMNSIESKITNGLNNLNKSAATESGIKGQIAQNQQLTQELVNINKQISQLPPPPATPESEITDLQSQLASVNQAMSQLLSGTEAVVVNLANQSLEMAAGAVPPAGSPVLTVPLPNVRQQMTVKDQAALFLTPSLITTIFRIMENVMHQKLENIDTFRQYSWNSTAAQEKMALSSAQATVLEGTLEANAQRAQAMGTLISAGLAMGLGFVSMGITIRTAAKVGNDFKDDQAELNEQLDNKVITPDQFNERSLQLSTSKHSALQNALQSNPLVMTFQTLTQSLPQMAQGAAGMVAAGYTQQAANAKAAGMLWQQALQAEQNITQDMQQAIQAAAQDATAILQTFGSISQSATSQS